MRNDHMDITEDALVSQRRHNSESDTPRLRAWASWPRKEQFYVYPH